MEADLQPVWRNPDKIFSAPSVFLFGETCKQRNEWLMQCLILRERCARIFPPLFILDFGAWWGGSPFPERYDKSIAGGKQKRVLNIVGGFLEGVQL